MNSGIQILFFVLLGFFFSSKWIELKQVKVNSYKTIVGFAVLLTVFIISVFIPQDTWIKGALYAIYFAGLPLLFRRINRPSELIQAILLWSAVACTTPNQGLPVFTLCSILLGLLAYKLTENFLFTSDKTFDDILPACTWVSALIWIGLTGRDAINIQNILLVCFSISIALRLLPSKFISNDKYFVKRLVLSVCAGLILLIVSKTILLQPSIVLAALFAGGTFFSYFFENKSTDDEIQNLLVSTSFLVVLGILTLIATRLIGDIGLVVLSAACCMNTGKGIFAALFWISRLLIQGFVLSNVANVTGINLMHPYCSAALFFGFLTLLLLSLILRIDTKQQTYLAAFLIVGLLVPPAIIYLIHEEAAASFLIASNVVAISLASFAPLIYKEPNVIKQNNVMLMPLFLATTGLLFAPLIEIGNHATVASRLQIVSYAIAALIVVCFILCNIKRMARNPV